MQIKLNAIKTMENYARYNIGVVSLSQGIPCKPSHPAIREAASKAILSGKVDKYSDPQGLVALRELIASKLQKENMLYGPEDIIITAGAIEGLMATFLTVLSSEKNEVIVPTPTYAAYFRIIQAAKGKVVQLPLEERDSWHLSTESVRAVITNKTAAILLCNPNNPTGSVYSRETLLAICSLVQKYNFFVVVDEVYKNMLFDDVPFFSPAEEKKFRKQVIRIVSFSKDFSLTGWRVGFLHADRSLVTKILPVHDSVINCAPVVSQYAALAALAYEDEILADNVRIYAKSRAVMKAYLDVLSDYVTYSMPKGSYFFFPKVFAAKETTQFCLDLLQKGQVAVVPGNDFGLGGAGHVRLCFGREEEDIRKGMEGFSKYLLANY